MLPELSKHFVGTMDAAWKAYKEQWMIGMDGETESVNSLLSVRLNGDDEMFPIRFRGRFFSFTCKIIKHYYYYYYYYYY